VASPVLVADTPRRHEVAHILRDHAHALNLTRHQARAVRDITACRTQRLGGHIEVCPECGFSRGSYNSCRNRHCPKCQLLKQELWAEIQEARLLPTAYFQIVFTVPPQLHRLFKRAPKLCLGLLFDAAAETLAAVATTKLKATLGFTAVLHTWSQKLGFHPHLHCLVPGGGLSLDKSRWIPTSRRFFLPVKALRKLFRGKLLAKLEQAIRAGNLPGELSQNLHHLRSTPKTWNVYAKRPLAGPRHLVRYLSRYVHRIAIANSRIIHYDGETVSFRYTDRADAGKTKTRTVTGPHFARLFLQHVLPPRFVRIRHYGYLSLRRRKDLARCRQLIGAASAAPPHKDASWVAAFERLFGANPLACPACKTGVLVIREVLPPIRS
jgi:Putative transposase/Transposase zinc-binding domain